MQKDNQQLSLTFTPSQESKQERCRRILAGPLGRVVRPAAELRFNYQRATILAQQGQTQCPDVDTSCRGCDSTLKPGRAGHPTEAMMADDAKKPQPTRTKNTGRERKAMRRALKRVEAELREAGAEPSVLSEDAGVGELREGAQLKTFLRG